MGSQRNGVRKENFILSVDVGTTSVRCHVYDKEAKIRGSCSTKVFTGSLLMLSPPHSLNTELVIVEQPAFNRKNGWK